MGYIANCADVCMEAVGIAEVVIYLLTTFLQIFQQFLVSFPIFCNTLSKASFRDRALSTLINSCSVKGQCIGIEVKQSYMISLPMKSLM